MNFKQFESKILTVVQTITIFIAVLMVPITFTLAVFIESVNFFRELLKNKL